MWRYFALAAALAVSSLTLRADDQSSVVWMDTEQLWEHKHSELVRAELNRRKEFIEAEIGTGAVPEWAGEYYAGDGLGKNVLVRIAPQGGFTYTWNGCLGLYDVNYGPVEVRGRRLTLSFELPNDAGTFGVPKHFVPVRWGERHYLLAEEELKPFVNAVNSAYEPCGPGCGPFLLRRGDEEKGVSGWPDLPEEYRKLFLDHPIAGRVVKVLDTETRFERDGYAWRTTKVEIDIGRDDGVWEGMELYSGLDTYVGSGFEVIRVSKHTSVAVVHDIVEADESGLAPGLCISTWPEVQSCPIEQTAGLR